MFRSPCLLILIPPVSLHVNLQRGGHSSSSETFIRFLRFSQVCASPRHRLGATATWPILQSLFRAALPQETHILAFPGEDLPRVRLHVLSEPRPDLEQGRAFHGPTLCSHGQLQLQCPSAKHRCPTGAPADDKDPLYVHTPQDCRLEFICALP